MRALLLGALWAHVSACALLMGAFFMLLLAGRGRVPSARRWDGTVVAYARVLVLVALGAGIVWLLARTAVFENRPHAALEPRAVWHAVLDTWPGLVWLTRHGVLVVLGAFLLPRLELGATRDWIAARAEALLLAALAVVLVTASSHAAAASPTAPGAVAADAVHLLATGLWIGALVPLALLLRVASRDAGADARPHAVLAARRFSRAALIVMMLLVASGLMNALVQVESVAGLAGTTHGRLLLGKLALLVPILALAAVNRRRVLPALAAPDAMRRLAAFVGVEAALALAVLALAMAMTLATPARHAEPVWPFPFRVSLEKLSDVPAAQWRTLLGSQLGVAGVVALVASFLVRSRQALVRVAAAALVALGAVVALPPLVVAAYPTAYKRPLVTYHAASIASGMTVYRQHCAACHGADGAGVPAADLRSSPTSWRHAGEIFWLVTHGAPRRGMPAFAATLSDAQRWDVINFIRTLAAAGRAGTIGREIEPDRAWLVAPDFTVAVGPLSPRALRDHRGRRAVLLVLYTLPDSRARLRELARSYDVLSILGVEVIAVPATHPGDALRELGGSPPALFPVVTDGTADIVATYRTFAPGPHAEILIDRQGYVRAIWRGGAERPPDVAAVQAQVERLNAEKSPPPFPDDHVH